MIDNPAARVYSATANKYAPWHVSRGHSHGKRMDGSHRRREAHFNNQLFLTQRPPRMVGQRWLLLRRI